MPVACGGPGKANKALKAKSMEIQGLETKEADPTGNLAMSDYFLF